jgi:hypothetical protein
MATQLVQGTKEYLIVDMTDKLGALSSLDGTNPRFTVYNPSNVKIYDEQTASNVGMTVYCLCDTSAAHPSGLWPPAEYRLSLHFDTPAESPVVEPGRFTVVVP